MGSAAKGPLDQVFDVICSTYALHIHDGFSLAERRKFRPAPLRSEGASHVRDKDNHDHKS